MTTNIQPSSRTILCVGTWRAVFATYSIAIVMAKYQPAQTVKPATRPMPPPGTVPGALAFTRKTPASIQTRKSAQRAKPCGTFSGRCLRRMTAMAAAMAKKISCASPSAHQSGNPM